MKQLMWLRIVHSGDWCLHLALSTPSGACQKKRRTAPMWKASVIFTWSRWEMLLNHMSPLATLQMNINVVCWAYKTKISNINQQVDSIGVTMEICWNQPSVISAPSSSQPDCVLCNDRRLFWLAVRNSSSAITNICCKHVTISTAD